MSTHKSDFVGGALFAVGAGADVFLHGALTVLSGAASVSAILYYLLSAWCRWRESEGSLAKLKTKHFREWDART